MDIIYLSSSCSEKKFLELQNKGITRNLPQAQKYHQLLLEGIRANISGNITALTLYPVNRKWSKKVYFKKEKESVNGIQYVYGSFFNVLVLKQISIYRNALQEITEVHAKNEKTVIICDILNRTLARAARKYGKKNGIPVIGIVTDVPGYRAGTRRKSYSFFRRKLGDWAEKQTKADMVKYDGYLLLTEAMNTIVNKFEKPYVVIEGHSDVKMAEAVNSFEAKTMPKVMMYAGGIHKEFGIQRLVNAFIEGKFIDWQFHIYGDGNYQEELKQIVINNENVKYFGVKPNHYIVEQQLRASLLVNPRLTDAEYVKYSFPSKTLECMASGTPLLTTRLPGMPKEYDSYVYLFNEETQEGFLKVLEKILHKSDRELFKKGQVAKEFAINKKNNIVQAKKLLEFIENNY